MVKKALLIGCNYLNSSTHRLQGCIYDVYEMKKVLINVFGYLESNIIMMSDNSKDILPTYSNILENLTNLVNLSNEQNNLEEIFVHYSGHGTQVQDINGDEPDNKDEGIVPIDFQEAGILIDDIIYDNFFTKLNPNCRIICVFDSCNSGSISDLSYSWISDGNKLYKSTLTNRMSIENRVFVLSGCTDNKYSYESIDPETGHPCGALSLELRNLLRENNWILPINTLVIGLTKKLKTRQYVQTPVLTGGFNCNENELVFINPNP